MPAAPKPVQHGLEPLPEGSEGLLPLKAHIAQRIVDARHQQIGRAAGLVYPQEPSEEPPVYPLSVHMEQRRLGQGREGLVHTVDHQVGPLLAAIFRKTVGQAQVRAMGLIHDQRNPPFVDDVRDCPDVRYPPLIGGRYHQHGPDIRLPLQSPADFLRLQGVIYAILLQIGRIQVCGPQAPQINPMIGRSVAVPRHQDMPSLGQRATDRAQYPAGAPVYEIEALLRPVKPGGLALQAIQDALRLMQVVEAVYLRDIYSAQFSGKHSEGSALVSRHVIGVDVALRMLPQLFK